MKPLGWIALAIALVCVVLFWPLRAPAQVASVTLDWTAPGDDGNVGTASTYEMRYSTTRPDTTGLAASPNGRTAALDSWWASASAVPGLPNPVLAGTRQSVTLTSGVSFSTTYYFLLKACDDGLPQGTNPTPIPNCSGYSNLASKNTGPPPDTNPPARVLDLIAR